MPLSPPTYIGLMDPTNPRGTDSRTISDDYHRNIQESVRQTLPNLTGEVSATHGDLNLLTGKAAASAKLMTGDVGTVGVFLQAAAPTGWTISTAFDGRALMVKGTLGGAAIPGGGTAGTDDPGLMDKVPSHTHTGTGAGAGVSYTEPYYSGEVLGVTPGTGVDRTQIQAGTTGAVSTTLTVDANAGAANWAPLLTATIACTLNA